MSVFNEIFTKDVEEKLLDSNAFLSNMKNVTEYLNGRTVHIPNFTQDMKANVIINGSSYAWGATETTETDLQFVIDSYRIKPFMVTDFQELQTNYAKMQLVTSEAIKGLTEVVAENILYKLASGVDATRKLTTSGALGTSNSKNGVTDYKKLSYVDILNIGQKMDEDNVPMEGRFINLDSLMYSELLQDEAVRKAGDFGTANLPNGVVASVGGINILKRGQVAHASSAGVVALYDDAVVDLDTRVALAWSSSVVVRAQSPVKVFTREDDPMLFGSSVSGEIALGCTNPRTDKKGAYIIYQG